MTPNSTATSVRAAPLTLAFLALAWLIAMAGAGLALWGMDVLPALHLGALDLFSNIGNPELNRGHAALTSSTTHPVLATIGLLVAIVATAAAVRFANNEGEAGRLS